VGVEGGWGDCRRREAELIADSALYPIITCNAGTLEEIFIDQIFSKHALWSEE